MNASPATPAINAGLRPSWSTAVVSWPQPTRHEWNGQFDYVGATLTSQFEHFWEASLALVLGATLLIFTVRQLQTGGSAWWFLLGAAALAFLAHALALYSTVNSHLDALRLNLRLPQGRILSREATTLELELIGRQRDLGRKVTVHARLLCLQVTVEPSAETDLYHVKELWSQELPAQQITLQPANCTVLLPWQVPASLPASQYEIASQTTPELTVWQLQLVLLSGRTFSQQLDFNLQVQ